MTWKKTVPLCLLKIYRSVGGYREIHRKFQQRDKSHNQGFLGSIHRQAPKKIEDIKEGFLVAVISQGRLKGWVGLSQMKRNRRKFPGKVN